MDIRTKGLNHLCFPTYYRGPFVASNIANLPLDLRSILAMIAPEMDQFTRVADWTCRTRFFSVGRPDKARAHLGWTPGARMRDVVKRLIESELRLACEPAGGN